MKPTHVCSIVLAIVLSSLLLHAQVSTITIPAGSPEDKGLQAISDEKDLSKRAALLQVFVQEFAANPSAVASGYSQLAQLAQADGKLPEALAYGDKALEAMPNSLDLLVSQTTLAEQAKQYSRAVDYAARGGNAVNGAPENERPQIRESYEFLETAAINSISGETDPKQMLAEVEKFNAAFPKSRFQDRAAQYALLALQQMNDVPRMMAFGEKALAADPNNLPLLTMMATALAEDPKGSHLARAAEFANRAIAMAKPDEPDPARRLSVGLAHSALGYAYLREEKTPAAIHELKTASGLVEADAAAYSTVLYRLGFTYAKLKRYPEAREVLSKAVNVDGPFKQASQELLGKVTAAAKK